MGLEKTRLAEEREEKAGDLPRLVLRGRQSLGSTEPNAHRVVDPCGSPSSGPRSPRACKALSKLKNSPER